MICQVHGVLTAVEAGAAQVEVGDGLTYEVLVPAFVQARLGGRIGEPVTLHTIHYLEGSSQGNHLVPRLAGFAEARDRAFFQLFTSVKGIGPRKALRAMSMSTAQIAAAIAERDAKLLQTLPEIGKRTAETIVAELNGKVDGFLGGGDRSADATDGAPAAPMASAAREALEVLLQLGESRPEAVRWIDEAQRRHPGIDDAEALIKHVFAIKHGA